MSEPEEEQGSRQSLLLAVPVAPTEATLLSAGSTENPSALRNRVTHGCSVVSSAYTD